MFGRWNKQSAKRHLERVNKMPKLMSALIEVDGERFGKFQDLIDAHMDRGRGASLKTLNLTGRHQITGLFRSAEDIYRLCSYYFPDVKYSEVTEYLVNNYHGDYCCTVGRNIFYTNKIKGPTSKVKTILNKIHSLKEVENEAGN